VGHVVGTKLGEVRGDKFTEGCDKGGGVGRWVGMCVSERARWDMGGRRQANDKEGKGGRNE